jgi:hypothetical protein
MRKRLIAAATMISACYCVAQAAEVSAVNPSIPVQPPPLMSPATPALTPAFKQQPLPLAPGEIRLRAEMQENVYGASGWSSTQNGQRR